MTMKVADGAPAAMVWLTGVVPGIDRVIVPAGALVNDAVMVAE